MLTPGTPTVSFFPGVTMPAPLPVPVRQQIRKLALEQHVPLAVIAQRLSLALRSVQNLVQRFRQQDKPDVRPAYRAPLTTPSPLRAEVLDLRQRHPRWGAGRIRVELRLLHPRQRLPSTRTLQRWCKAQHQPPAPPG